MFKKANSIQFGNNTTLGLQNKMQSNNAPQRI